MIAEIAVITSTGRRGNGDIGRGKDMRKISIDDEIGIIGNLLQGLVRGDRGIRGDTSHYMMIIMNEKAMTKGESLSSTPDKENKATGNTDRNRLYLTEKKDIPGHQSTENIQDHPRKIGTEERVIE